MLASFFPSQGHVFAILDRQTAVRQQLFALMAGDPAPPITTCKSGTNTRGFISRTPSFNFTIFKVYCFSFPCKRTKSYWIIRLGEKIAPYSYFWTIFLRVMREKDFPSFLIWDKRRFLQPHSHRSQMGDVTPLSFSYCLSEIVEMKCQDNISLLGSQGYKLWTERWMGITKQQTMNDSDNKGK